MNRRRGWRLGLTFFGVADSRVERSAVRCGRGSRPVWETAALVAGALSAGESEYVEAALAAIAEELGR